MKRWMTKYSYAGCQMTMLYLMMGAVVAMEVMKVPPALELERR